MKFARARAERLERVHHLALVVRGLLTETKVRAKVRVGVDPRDLFVIVGTQPVEVFASPFPRARSGFSVGFVIRLNRGGGLEFDQIDFTRGGRDAADRTARDLIELLVRARLYGVDEV